MSSPLTVVKVGGSLADDGAALRAVLAHIAEGAEGSAVIVPGGGPFADAVRAVQATLGFDDALAHRFALDAMGRMADVFRALEPRLVRAADLMALRVAVRSKRVPVWDPAALRAGDAAIPESWDVTSDSLALWLAARLDAARCLLVKSAPCPADVGPDELARRGLVDRAFPAFARHFSGAIVMCGPGLRAGRRVA